MTENRIAVALEKYSRQIPSNKIIAIKEELKTVPDERMDEFMSLPMKSKAVTAVLGIFLGGVAANRFYIGDVKLGVARLATLIACFVISMFIPFVTLVPAVWSIVDIFLAYKKAKINNYCTLSGFAYRYKQSNTAQRKEEAA